MSQENLEQRVTGLETMLKAVINGMDMMTEAQNLLSQTTIAHTTAFLAMQNAQLAEMKCSVLDESLPDDKRQKWLAKIAKWETAAEKMEAKMATLKSKLPPLFPPSTPPPPPENPSSATPES